MTDTNKSDLRRDAEVLAGTLTDEKVIAHLKKCQKLSTAAVGELFPKFFKLYDEQMTELCEAASTNQDQSLSHERQRILHQNAENLQYYLSGFLGEGFIKFNRGELATHTGEEKYEGDMLSLVENEDLEETIAIASISHRSENYNAEVVWELNQRFSVLNGGKKVDESSNPVSPIQYCEALRKSMARVEFDTNTKIVAYKAFEEGFLAQLPEVLAQVNDYLKQQGFLPNLRYKPGGYDAPPVAQVEEIPFDRWTDETNPAPPPQSNHYRQTGHSASSGQVGAAPQTLSGLENPAPTGLIDSPDASLPTDQYQNSLMSAIKVLQGHIGGVVSSAAQIGGSEQAIGGSVAGSSIAAGTGSGQPQSGASIGNQASGAPAAGGAAAPGGRQVTLYNNDQLVGAIQTLQRQVMGVSGQDLLGFSADQIKPQSFIEVGSQLRNQLKEEAEDKDQAVDAEDMQIIDLVGMLFEYMLSDDNLPSSIKALLSYLHTPFLKIAFIDKDFFEQVNHPARLLLNSMAEAAVKWVGNDGSDEYEFYEKIKLIVSKILEEFENDVRIFAELLMEFSGYTKKISRRQDLLERRALEKVQGEEKLKEVKIRVNDAVRSRTDGQDIPSAVLLLLLQPWSDYLAFILLRYGEESDSWKRANQVVDDVLWSIKPKEKSTEKARQMELHDFLHTELETGFETIGYDQAKSTKLIEALFSLQKMALQSKKVEPAPAPMRDKLESMAAEKAGKPKANEPKATPEEQRMVENLKMIEFGTWFEFEGGKRLKVAWYNSKTLHYMLVDQMGKKVAMKSGLELARAMLTHKARVIAGSSKPFFERALENIFQSLNAKAEHAQVD
jgi:hypothetical protein